MVKDGGRQTLCRQFIEIMIIKIRMNVLMGKLLVKGTVPGIFPLWENQVGSWLFSGIFGFTTILIDDRFD